jgi:hypothetical protein
MAIKCQNSQPLLACDKALSLRDKTASSLEKRANFGWRGKPRVGINGKTYRRVTGITGLDSFLVALAG